MRHSMPFQDQMPENHCFGCGARNPRGLRIKSTWEGDIAMCRYVPEPHQNAGPPQYVNGGIIATVIDCHSVCTAIADAYRRENRTPSPNDIIWYVTGTLTIKYLRPAPIEVPLDLKAHVTAVDGRRTMLACQVTSGSTECATAQVVAIRVPDDWRTQNTS